MKFIEVTTTQAEVEGKVLINVNQIVAVHLPHFDASTGTKASITMAIGKEIPTAETYDQLLDLILPKPKRTCSICHCVVPCIHYGATE